MLPLRSKTKVGPTLENLWVLEQQLEDFPESENYKL